MEAALQLGWQQWTALGVAGTVAPPDHAVDLEALICFTPFLAADDPRLGDEALDWCVAHSRRLISITRLRRQRDLLPPGCRAAFDEFAAKVNGSSNTKTAWPTDRRAHAATTSMKSRPPDLERPPLLQLHLRALFGVTARAEVLVQFLRPGMTQETKPNLNLSVSELTDLGYSKPAITDILADLTNAGLLEKWRRGNRDQFTLARREALLGLIGGVLPATAPNWSLRLRAAASLIEVERQNIGKKDVVQVVALARELGQLQVSGMLDRAGVRPPGIATEIGKWGAESLFR